MDVVGGVGIGVLPGVLMRVLMGLLMGERPVGRPHDVATGEEELRHVDLFHRDEKLDGFLQRAALALLD